MSDLSATAAFKAFEVVDPAPVEGAWLLSPLEELIPTGEYEGNTMVAADAILLIADDIEKHGVAPEGRKALADLLRYLATFALHPPVST
ncbi:hypothetical protein O9X99_02105 [Agrobacterium salinitolerans]|uniref:Uncharacterized protein n=1 Tax=Agrobacterium salinitolerans TaxID=1183413 RepID=A0ABY3BW43_9HYPH|nr:MULTISPECIES: hypothetical protein [Agrobacterium]MCZ7890461.1 hypothetical protein [Agrobacterium salinitolerans]TRA96817.1 hypothetical protein EXN23_00850 [Agrobacterium salinitolerans]